MSLINNGVRQRGLTLIEILIALAVSAVILTGVITVFVSTVDSSSEAIKTARLNQQLRAAMEIMTNDIRRTGYWIEEYEQDIDGDGTLETDIDGDGTDETDNPYADDDDGTQFEEDLGLPLGSPGNCIVYSYDSGKDHAATPADNERYGFRLNGSAIQMRRSSATTIDDDVSNGTCSGNWETLTDPNEVEVTALTFDDSNSQCIDAFDEADCNAAGWTATANESLAVETRQIDITLTGRLVSDNSITLTINESVRLPNNRVTQY